jgi:SAM-dependent methyltransferase
MEAFQERRRFEGVANVVRFNWPYYVIALVVIFAGLTFLEPSRANVWLHSLILATVGLSGYFSIASLIASHWVYDLSDLYRLNWLSKIVKKDPKRVIQINAGFDETSRRVRSAFPEADLIVLDIFDPNVTTEASISRAHQFKPTENAIRVKPEKLTVETVSADLVLTMLSVHEVQDSRILDRFFRELHRILKEDGMIVLVEHFQDLANFLAFGVGFLHFKSDREWRRAISQADLRITQELKITPFVRAFVICRS